MRLFVFFSIICSIKGLTKSTQIFLTGATSQLGRKYVTKMTDKGYSVRCLVRNHELADDLFKDNRFVELIEGDVLDKEFLIHATKGCKMVVSLHGVIRPSSIFNFWKYKDSNPIKEPLEYTPKSMTITDSLDGVDKTHPYFVNYIGMINTIEACETNGIKNLVKLTGLLCGFPSYNPISFIFNAFYSNNIYWHKKSEELLGESHLNHIIIRPGGIRDDKQFEDYELSYDDTIKPPALINTDILSDVISKISKVCYWDNIPKKQSIVSCKGISD
tara:strand:- start:38 stop:856 length:819 start_codon:yes stop_codon:yes gene_type:complete